MSHEKSCHGNLCKIFKLFNMICTCRQTPKFGKLSLISEKIVWICLQNTKLSLKQVGSTVWFYHTAQPDSFSTDDVFSTVMALVQSVLVECKYWLKKKIPWKNVHTDCSYIERPTSRAQFVYQYLFEMIKSCRNCLNQGNTYHSTKNTLDRSHLWEPIICAKRVWLDSVFTERRH